MPEGEISGTANKVNVWNYETSIYSSLKIALTILLQLNRDDARLFSIEGLGEHQFFSLICMHCNKKVGAMRHRLHPPAKNPAGDPGYSIFNGTSNYLSGLRTIAPILSQLLHLFC